MIAICDLITKYKECLKQIEDAGSSFDWLRLMYCLVNLLRLAQGIYCVAVMEKDPYSMAKASSLLEKIAKSTERILEIMECRQLEMDAAGSEIMSILNELQMAHMGDFRCGA